ncbi:hypothetical protein [Marimonas arenosa]|uniref:Lipoprotein n=1 Tax=Marimonas arenosa TaxID=1795305 RepID=A0AAE4B6Z3_9RHOB|nr:hypothetical protein [Marimonas arenosa]MDQ2090906.1 hypothetical protein [Marimonas arenosa]
MRVQLRHLSRLLPLLAALALAACAAPPPMAGQDDIAALAREIRALSPQIDPAEADRAARIAYTETFQLSRQYGITDPPLIHNTKVNAGLRPRGLCWHWAEDMENRLAREGFETLALHRAIANSDNPLRIEHSTTIVSAKGAGMYDGIVLDPWRKGGRLTWAQTRADTDYKWLPRRQVLVAKQERRARRGPN